MATVQRSTTKKANRLISYAEKRAAVTSGINIMAATSKAQMAATRNLFGKNDGIQAHHIVQSFRPGEVTPQDANEIGKELAEFIAPGHEIMIYTHTDKHHIHNHIVINSVNTETGMKYHSDRADLYNIRDKSDEICLKHGLSIVQEEDKADRRYTRAELAMLNKGERSWKEDIRQAVEESAIFSKNFKEFQSDLKEVYNIFVDDRGKDYTYHHEFEGTNRKVRGYRLGNLYTKEEMLDRFRVNSDELIWYEMDSHDPLGYFQLYEPMPEWDPDRGGEFGLIGFRQRLTKKEMKEGNVTLYEPVPSQERKSKSKKKPHQSKWDFER